MSMTATWQSSRFFTNIEHLYPDGEVIQVWTAPQKSGEPVCFWDIGRTLRQFKDQSVQDNVTDEQRAMVREMCESKGAVFDRGSITLERRADELDAAAADRLGRLCSEVAFALKRSELQQAT